MKKMFPREREWRKKNSLNSICRSAADPRCEPRWEDGRRREEETSEWEVFNFQHFTFLPLPLNFQCEQKRKKRTLKVWMCFSVLTILKDQWKGSVIKGLYVSRLIVSWEARFQPSCRRTKHFQTFFTQSCYVQFHWKKRKKIFCNFCM